MAYDEILEGRIRAVLEGQPGLTAKKMFGGVGFMVNGNMACGVNKLDLIVRVGPKNYEEALSKAHTRPFDMTGRPMKGWVVVLPDGYAAEADLRAWLGQGLDFVLSLPPK